MSSLYNLVDKNGFTLVTIKNQQNEYPDSDNYITRLEYLTALFERGEIKKDDFDKMNYNMFLELALYEPFSSFIFKTYNIKGLPLNKNCSLLPYQVDILKTLHHEESKNHKGIRGGILDLEMGLGKTLIMLSHIITHEKLNNHGPTLVIVSKSVLNEWEKQYNKFFSDSKVKTLFIYKDYMKESEMNDLTLDMINEYDIVLTTYDVCRGICEKNSKYIQQCCEYGDDHSLQKDKIINIHHRENLHSFKKLLDPTIKGLELLYNINWTRIICDESQKIVNSSSRIYRSIMPFIGEYRWCLTGTPVKNKKEDLFSQLRYIGYNSNKCQRIIDWKENGEKLMIEENLGSKIYKANYKSCSVELPLKFEILVDLDLSHNERYLYDILAKMISIIINKFRSRVPGFTFANVLASFTLLRLLVIAPYLLTTGDSTELKKLYKYFEDNNIVIPNEDKTNPQTQDMVEWLKDISSTSGLNSSKVSATLNLIKTIPCNKKILIFSYFSKCLNLLNFAIKKTFPDKLCLQFDGSKTSAERKKVLDQFQNNDCENGTILLLTYKAGGEGLNLPEANICILIDPWWNDATHNQARSRCYRTGQTKPVYVYTLLCNNTIENRIMTICADKNTLAENLLDSSKTLKKSEGLSLNNIMYMLGLK